MSGGVGFMRREVRLLREIVGTAEGRCEDC